MSSSYNRKRVFLLAVVIPATTFANTQEDCSIECPSSGQSSELSTDYESSSEFIVYRTSNCPPYPWTTQNTPNTPCYDPRWWYVPKVPQALDNPDPIGTSNPLMGPIGVLRNGVLISGPVDSLGRDAMLSRLSLMDSCMSYTDGYGVHYTLGLFAYYNGFVRSYDSVVCGLPLDNTQTRHSPLLGWMWDGYGIYGRWNGRYSYVDLDDCGGHEHPVETFGNRQEEILYHYHMSPNYPYTINCFHGCAERTNNLNIIRRCTFEAESTLMPTISPTRAPSAPTGQNGIGGLLSAISVEMVILLVVAVCVLSMACLVLCLCMKMKKDRHYYNRPTENKTWRSNTQLYPGASNNRPNRGYPRPSPPQHTTERQQMIVGRNFTSSSDNRSSHRQRQKFHPTEDFHANYDQYPSKVSKGFRTEGFHTNYDQYPSRVLEGERIYIPNVGIVH